MTTQPTILIVDDEIAQREILDYNLRAEGYTTVQAENGEAALLAVEEHQPDMIILDWMMPLLSGIEVCRQLKARAETRDIPVIMLSARGEEDDKIRGLDTGADDYIAKPYSIRELVARVNTQLRRIKPSAAGVQLQFEDITLDTINHRIFRGSDEVKLGPTEYRLLVTFLERPGRVWPRDSLLDRVWGRDVFVDTRTVDVHVGRLRKSLCKFGGTDPIRTVRGAGYALG